LTLFLKTLSIILHATGSSAVALPQMTSELWDLLFSLRNHSFPTSNDSSVQEAVLFALLTLLEVNTSNDNGRRLADEHAKELLETQEWVSGIMESGQLGEEEKGRILAASVIVRIRGIVDAYQRRLMGEMLSLEA
jgi:telomere length regulation protein